METAGLEGKRMKREMDRRERVRARVRVLRREGHGEDG